jgi:hypothetical protein
MKIITFCVLLLHLGQRFLLVFTVPSLRQLFLGLHTDYILLVWLWLGRNLRDYWLIYAILFILRHFLIYLFFIFLRNRHHLLRNYHFFRCFLCILRRLIDHAILLRVFLHYLCVGCRVFSVLSQSLFIGYRQDSGVWINKWCFWIDLRGKR